MDRHFRLTALQRERARARRLRRPATTPRSAGAETRAIFAYDERLRLLPSYLQQLEMESNGKGVTHRRQAASAARPRRSPGAGSAPTRSTRCSSCSTRARTSSRSNSSAVIEPGDTLAEDHHRQLLLNASRRARR